VQQPLVAIPRDLPLIFSSFPVSLTRRNFFRSEDATTRTTPCVEVKNGGTESGLKMVLFSKCTKLQSPVFWMNNLHPKFPYLWTKTLSSDPSPCVFQVHLNVGQWQNKQPSSSIYYFVLKSQEKLRNKHQCIIKTSTERVSTLDYLEQKITTFNLTPRNLLLYQS
jgi:hypothetical protein